MRWTNASANQAQTSLGIRVNADATGGNHILVAITQGYANTSEEQSDNQWTLTEINSSGSASSVAFGFIYIDGCNSSGIKTFVGNVGTNGDQTYNLRRSASGIYTGTSVVSSLVFRAGFGSTFDAGTVYVYGAN